MIAGLPLTFAQPLLLLGLLSLPVLWWLLSRPSSNKGWAKARGSPAIMPVVPL